MFWNAPLQGILGQLKVEKDVNYVKPNTDTRLSWIHRKTADADYYFVLNMRNHPENLAITFRVSDKTPELWHADKGTTESVSYKMENGLTTVKLHFDAQESVFVVFQKAASQRESTVSERKVRDSQKIEGTWSLNFPDNWGAPKQVTLGNLASWSNHTDEGVKYFSGTATYAKEIEIKKGWKKPDATILLDLGTVKDIAVVWVIGVEIETLWKAPYRVDISKAIKAGKNKLEIKVTNQGDNRIAGDSKLPKEQKILQISSGGIRFGGDPKPKESGLLGPVLLKLE